MDLLGQQRGAEWAEAFIIIRIRRRCVLRELVPPSSEYQYKLHSFSIKHSYVWIIQVIQQGRKREKENVTV